MRSLLNVPAEVVSANINAAVAKAAAKKRRIFVLGIMAGAFIAMGAQSSSLAVHNITDVGIARTLAGCIFPVGLMMIVFVGGELFTGDCMMSMACMKGRIGFGSLLRTLLIVYLGNFAGAVLIAFLVAHSGQYDYSAGALGAYTIKTAVGKTGLSFMRALFSGILCNILVCAAVFVPILAFVVSGFEHCVANMYYIPAGIFAAGNPAYVQKAQELYGLGAEKLTGLNWGSFVTVNLLPVTIGNIIDGAVMVGGVCFYLHGKAEG